jgi:tetratricopeptide (TPR) repeat protein
MVAVLVVCSVPALAQGQPCGSLTATTKAAEMDLGRGASSASTDTSSPRSQPDARLPSLDASLLAYREGRFEQAEAATATALSLNPESAHWRLLHSALLLRRAQWTTAWCVLEGLSAEFPELAPVHNNRAVWQAAQGDWESAQISLREALRAEPGHFLALANLAEVHLQLAHIALEAASRQQAGDAALARRLAQVRALASSPQVSPSLQ